LKKFKLINRKTDSFHQSNNSYLDAPKHAKKASNVPSPPGSDRRRHSTVKNADFTKHGDDVLTHSEQEHSNEEQDNDPTMRMWGPMTQVQFSNPRFVLGSNQLLSEHEDDAAVEEVTKGKGANMIARPPETAPSSEMQRIQRGKKNEKISLMRGILNGMDKVDLVKKHG